ncbi:DUF6676 family protein [Gordonia humi]|uniref:Rv1476 family membrane protein n=1 Tax=Gordonia humi TaxID=686429 RepID=UPI00360898E4
MSAPADQVPELTKVVKDAEADGHDLYLVVIDESFSPFTVYRDIAHEIQTSTGGTVLVFGPTGLGTSSTDFSRVQIEDATSEMHKGVSIPQQAREIYDKATQPNVDWTLTTIVLIVVVVIGAVVARMLARRPKAAASDDAPPDAGDAGSSPDEV